MTDNDQYPKDPPHDLSILFLRILAGTVFIFHGGRKSGMFQGEGIDRYIQRLESVEMPLSTVVGYGTTGVELVGGLFILAGFCTRLATFPMLLTTGLTALYFHSHAFSLSDRAGLGSPYGGYEYSLTLMVILLVLLISGAGRFSLRSILVAAPKR